MSPDGATCTFFLQCPDDAVYAYADLKVEHDGAWSLIYYRERELIPTISFGDKSTPASELLAALFQGTEITR